MKITLKPSLLLPIEPVIVGLIDDDPFSPSQSRKVVERFLNEDNTETIIIVADIASH